MLVRSLATRLVSGTSIFMERVACMTFIIIAARMHAHTRTQKKRGGWVGRGEEQVYWGLTLRPRLLHLNSDVRA